jgi:hypothetical protein
MIIHAAPGLIYGKSGLESPRKNDGKMLKTEEGYLGQSFF